MDIEKKLQEVADKFAALESAITPLYAEAHRSNTEPDAEICVLVDEIEEASGLLDEAIDSFSELCVVMGHREHFDRLQHPIPHALNKKS